MCYSWDVNLQAGHYLPTLCGLRGNWIDTGSSGWRSSRLFPWQSYMLSVVTSELTCKCNLSLFICIKFLSKNLLLFSSFYHGNLFLDNLFSWYSNTKALLLLKPCFKKPYDNWSLWKLKKNNIGFKQTYFGTIYYSVIFSIHPLTSRLPFWTCW